MSEILNDTFQHSEITNSHSGVRMKFWGICCIGGKAYKQVVNYRFHLTMAVLDPKSYDRNIRDRVVTLSVIQHGQIFLLCVLKHGEIQQINLNLIFDKGDDVMFSVGGYGTVHLTGYQLIDSSDSAFNKDNEHYCPVAELGSEKQLLKRLNFPVNGVETKNKEKANSKLLMKALMGTTNDNDDNDDDDDDEDEEDDSDFAIDIKEIEDVDESDEEAKSDEDFEIEEDEIQGLKDDYEMETPPKSEGSQKRKLGNVSLSQKRQKKEKCEPESEENVEIIKVEDNESDADEGGLDSSIGNTPMPKKLDDTAKAKKTKKKKRLSEISSLDKSEKADGDTLLVDKTPKKKLESKQPIIKLEGGVEYQDVLVGRGPPATNGKVVSVFYVGRLENTEIFDARCSPKKPFSFKLGVPEVIKGLDIGIKDMRVGGQRKLKIPPNMGYGSKVMNGIPANSTLFFTVELMSVN